MGTTLLYCTTDYFKILKGFNNVNKSNPDINLRNYSPDRQKVTVETILNILRAHLNKRRKEVKIKLLVGFKKVFGDLSIEEISMAALVCGSTA